MNFDIYGGILCPGHCEVHPHIHMTYPCPNYIEETKHRQTESAEYEKCLNEQYTQLVDSLTGIHGEVI